MIENNLALNAIDDKINLLSMDIYKDIEALKAEVFKEEPTKKKVSWKGFSR